MVGRPGLGYHESESDWQVGEVMDTLGGKATWAKVQRQVSAARAWGAGDILLVRADGLCRCTKSGGLERCGGSAIQALKVWALS